MPYKIISAEELKNGDRVKVIVPKKGRLSLKNDTIGVDEEVIRVDESKVFCKGGKGFSAKRVFLKR
jgi:hypothetical protein